MNKNKIRVGFLAHGIYYGGATTSLYLLLKALSNEEYVKILYAPSIRSENMKNDFLKYCDKIKIIPIDQIRNAATCYTTEKRFKNILHSDCSDIIKTLQDDNIDILHINTTVFSQVYEAIKKKTKIRIITHVRELIPKYQNGIVQEYILKNITEYSDALICISENEQKQFVTHSKTYIIPNPFDFSNLNIESNFRKENNIPNDYILVGMLGQFERSKGQHVFLRALVELQKSNSSNYKFLFVLLGINSFTPLWKVIIKKLMGKKDYSYEINCIIKKNALKNKIILIPYSYNILHILKDLDIIIRPSLSKDPWGRDVIESMALSKPVIAVGSSEFYIKNNETGFLINEPDPVLIAEKISTLINNAGIRKQFGIRGYKRIKEMCDHKSYIKKIKEIYDEVLAL